MSAAPPGQLAWRCRRGMQELDLLLLRWLERHYGGASLAQRARFAQLLDLPDPELAALLLGARPPADPALGGLLGEMRGS